MSLSTVTISIENLKIVYMRKTRRTRSLKGLILSAINRETGRLEIKTALDISQLEIRSGELVGIIGRNGSGKSTLIKAIARVIPPSEGRIKVFGHVEPMIELGIGFNGELTGRENILLNAAIHGRNGRLEPDQTNAIIEWSGLKESIDFPVRTYSTGMIARLAFAVATDITPDIVLIDEMLSVGDLDFAGKSSARIEEIIERGRTVVLVSHNLELVRKLSTRCIWLENGKIRMDGKTEEVLAGYLSSDSPETNPSSSN